MRFRAEGIINDSDASKFVICNVPRDSETGWGATEDVGIGVLFRRTSSGTPAITSNQCTLSVGFNLTEPLQSKTYSAVPYRDSSTYGAIVMHDGKRISSAKQSGSRPAAVFLGRHRVADAQPSLWRDPDGCRCTASFV